MLPFFVCRCLDRGVQADLVVVEISYIRGIIRPALSGFAFIRAAEFKNFPIECVHLIRRSDIEADHGPVAMCCRLAVKGFSDSERETLSQPVGHALGPRRLRDAEMAEELIVEGCGSRHIVRPGDEIVHLHVKISQVTIGL